VALGYFLYGVKVTFWTPARKLRRG
jgi:hypothetical protein